MIADTQGVLQPYVDVRTKKIRQDSYSELGHQSRIVATREQEELAPGTLGSLVVQQRQESVEISVEHLRFQLAGRRITLSLSGLKRQSVCEL